MRVSSIYNCLLRFGEQCNSSYRVVTVTSYSNLVLHRKNTLRCAIILSNIIPASTHAYLLYLHCCHPPPQPLQYTAADLVFASARLLWKLLGVILGLRELVVVIVATLLATCNVELFTPNALAPSPCRVISSRSAPGTSIPCPPSTNSLFYQHHKIIFGQTTHLTHVNSYSPPLSTEGVKRIQGIIGALLYYACSVDNKLLATLSTLSF